MARFTTQAQLDKYSKFLTDNPNVFNAEEIKTLDVAKVTFTKNLAWINKNVPVIMQYIDDRTSSGAVAKSVGIMLFVTAFLLISSHLFN